ncbi:MAG: hypothetical protein MN733_15770 [Nitrososphaera sp.]|nr:hypothetical protein [Nitrososphaera sp.]
MKGDPVPNTDHISRYGGGAHIKPDGTVSGTAFRLRERLGQPERYLSVNWLEYLNKSERAAEIAEIRTIFAAKFKRVGSQAKIAVLNIGELRDYVFQNSEDNRDLQVLHEPDEPEDPSHSGVHNLRLDDNLIADLIAQTVQEIYPARGD